MNWNQSEAKRATMRRDTLAGQEVLSEHFFTLKVEHRISSNDHVITYLAGIKNKSYSIQA